MSKETNIDTFLNKIVAFYSLLKGANNLEAFLKQEVRCIDESLDLINLNIPLSQEYKKKCRQAQRENLQKENFISLSGKLNSNIISNLSKSYSTMTEIERISYDAFICCFPVEIEPGDLLIEIFTDNILEYTVNEDAYLSILHKYFKDIIEL